MSRCGLETYSPPARVDFNPEDQEHLLALALLQLHGRQHPTLRFKLNPTQYGNVYLALIDKFIRAYIPEDIQLQASVYAEDRKPLIIGSLIDSATDVRIKLKEPKNG
jgi:hypothetical protein